MSKLLNKFEVDYTSLKGVLTKRKVYKLADVQSKISKIGFDVVRFADPIDNIDGLWKIEHMADGDYIVAMYGEGESEQVKKASKSYDWNVIADKAGKNLNLFYKGAPIVRIAMASLNMSDSDANEVASYLPEKLASNDKLVSALMQEIAPEERKELLTKYPELGCALTSPKSNK
jgi:hypothetical protein